MQVLEAARWLGAVLRAIPGPTDAWADIIGSIAWPMVATFLVVRFRRYIRMFLDTLAARLQTDHFKLGPFELTPNADVIALDPRDVADSTEVYAPDDTVRIERIFAFIAEPANFHRLAAWVNDNVQDTLDVGDFVTAPAFAPDRKRAYEALRMEET